MEQATGPQLLGCTAQGIQLQPEAQDKGLFLPSSLASFAAISLDTLADKRLKTEIPIIIQPGTKLTLPVSKGKAYKFKSPCLKGIKSTVG